MDIVKPSFRIVRPFDEVSGIQELKFIEREARRCYKTEEKITEDSYLRFVRMLCSRNHNAMLGFGEMHVELICDRGVTHEAVRHRLCEFAQESTRYCDYTGKGIQVVCPDEIAEDQEAFNIWENAMFVCERAYNDLGALGHKPQIARSVLPTCLKTELGWKANFQEWRHIFSQRTSPAAHPQMRELLVPLLEEARRIIPVVFDEL